MGVAMAPLHMPTVCHKNRFGAIFIYKPACSLDLTTTTAPWQKPPGSTVKKK
jgi:hypothetical protein